MEIPALAASSDLLIAFITLWFLSCYSMVYDVLTYGLRYVSLWFPEEEQSCIFVIFLGELRPPPHIGVPLIGGRKYEGGETSEGGWSIECQPVASILRYDFMLQCFCEQFVIELV